ncbi:Zn(II)2Cys6 transcription factor domain-containing protein [Aspergillus brunneoviolaceus CBS 621.78]|uniref:Uncharacterized protein n=1 Tax=Aspergillus brunneoviolaceus CBS 621.78 TaxID=1450534 RepID=A0ACD1G5V2_9EURO|nr:hypothetical protein BO95DRAFT_444025 [Aspergillus brunneoviolaceus CBS 621.78]RAH44651.1 hypothetical protein BO95DRAFT_444025 [Aspergillus brunneoviolaceus CBS 621.78]
MYKPAPPRPKKTDIIRSRDGCTSCRKRRTKCDEEKPACGTCVRLGKECEYLKPGLRFQIVTGQSSRSPSEDGAPSNATAQELAGDQASSIQNKQRLRIGTNSLVKSLQTTERDVFYTTYWEDRCLPAVHPVFHSTTLLIPDMPIIRDAVLALSSCNISRLRGERKVSATALMGPWSPSLTHQTASHLYYSSAIRRLAALTLADFHHNNTVILTTLVLLAHLESAMGNFMGFCCHVQGIMNLLEWRQGVADPTIRSLLTSWMQIRYVVWWARAYFSSVEIHQQLPSIPLPVSLVKNLPHTPHGRRVLALSIMCESHRLNFNAAFQYSRGQINPRRTEEDPATCISRLHQQAATLDEWLAHLPPAEQPIYGPIDPTGNPIIHFSSHDAALNYAYHVVARIMQCSSFLALLQNPHSTFLDHEPYEEDIWVQTLVRIAQGTDMQTSLTRNSYTIGFTGLLLAGILRCRSLSTGLEIEQWLQRLLDLQPTEEGAFPVYQTLSVVQAINRQRAVGRDVFAVTQPVDDGGGLPKVTAYNSQSISCLVFHGYCRRMGVVFEECVVLGG